ncbi:hypothetical protein U1Q18_027119 [Sarracenia purpurea var. burkii]
MIHRFADLAIDLQIWPSMSHRFADLPFSFDEPSICKSDHRFVGGSEPTETVFLVIVDDAKSHGDGIGNDLCDSDGKNNRRGSEEEKDEEESKGTEGGGRDARRRKTKSCEMNGED